MKKKQQLTNFMYLLMGQMAVYVNVIRDMEIPTRIIERFFEDFTDEQIEEMDIEQSSFMAKTYVRDRIRGFRELFAPRSE